MKHKLPLLVLIAAASLLWTGKAEGQNIQLHYDFERNCATSTIEMFRPDKGGSTFFFVDIDYTPKVRGAYFEIARELCFWQGTKAEWLSLHIEYNGGADIDAGSYNNAILAGLTWSAHSADFSRTCSVSAMYKAIPGTVDGNGNSQIHNFQLTGVWKIDFARRWCTFCGFIDFWREHRPWQNTEFIMITEPQFWVNLDRIKGWDDIHLSVGTEVEMSANFVGRGFGVLPTCAIKWTF